MTLDNMFIIIVIMLVLSWLFENKILPQIIILFLTLFVSLREAALGSSPEYFIIAGVLVLYCGLQIFESGKAKESD